MFHTQRNLKDHSDQRWKIRTKETLKTTLILLENHLGKKQINAADKQNIVKDDWFKIFRMNRL